MLGNNCYNIWGCRRYRTTIFLISSGSNLLHIFDQIMAMIPFATDIWTRLSRRVPLGLGCRHQVLFGILTCRAQDGLLASRQWPKVCELCHTFLHVARVRNYIDMQELLVFQKTQGHVRIAHITCPWWCQYVFWLAQRAKCATKFDTSGHCLLASTA